MGVAIAVGLGGVLGACFDSKVLLGAACQSDADCWKDQHCAFSPYQSGSGMDGACAAKGDACIAGAQAGCACDAGGCSSIADLSSGTSLVPTDPTNAANCFCCPACKDGMTPTSNLCTCPETTCSAPGDCSTGNCVQTPYQMTKGAQGWCTPMDVCIAGVQPGCKCEIDNSTSKGICSSGSLMPTDPENPPTCFCCPDCPNYGDSPSGADCSCSSGGSGTAG